MSGLVWSFCSAWWDSPVRSQWNSLTAVSFIWATLDTFSVPVCCWPVVDSDVQFNEPFWGIITKLQWWLTLMCYSETCVKFGKIGFQEQRWRIPISSFQRMFAVFPSYCLNHHLNALRWWFIKRHYEVWTGFKCPKLNCPRYVVFASESQRVLLIGQVSGALVSQMLGKTASWHSKKKKTKKKTS